ncbi:MAG: hypothetical protein R3C40_12370 [Parvularculaceae bacterium]
MKKVNDMPGGLEDREINALDAVLKSVAAPPASDALRASMLADFDALQRSRRAHPAASALVARLRDFLGVRTLAPAGLLAGITALGFAAGVASAGSMIAISDEQSVFLTAAIDEGFLVDEEMPAWVED